MALMLGSFLSASSQRSKSMFPSSAISIKTGCAPAYRIALDVAKKELGVVSTLSPLFSKTREARCSAAVPLATARQYLTSQYSAKASSKA